VNAGLATLASMTFAAGPEGAVDDRLPWSGLQVLYEWV